MTDIINNPKVRVHWIDVAKGLCILLIVFGHIDGYLHTRFPLEDALKKFEVPLFFFLSGLTFKYIPNFIHFFKKKVVSLLIPFAVWYFGSVLLAFFLINTCHLSLENVQSISLSDELVEIFIREDCPNGPVWFLLCLFFLNILYWCVCYVVNNSIKLLYGGG